ncbi:MAG: class I mannose-6-phosphate isomerase [Oligoflexus sp.]|nr:class I mannose-6-phosphate isomerase [Oligoflexus sp.]
MKQTLKLSPNLFTPLSRTPWGGFDIARRYKQNWVKDPKSTAIGESWEVSCDPAFPSKVVGTETTLIDLVMAEPERMLSPAYVKAYGATCEILLKLVNAAQPLSLQVHPTDEDPSLKPYECGKPESWLVLDAEPGSGLYLGFSQSITSEELGKLLHADQDIKSYLQFVPVKEGDYFEIQPGVIHAIGAGITLLEPQRIRTGKAGKTYRFWDWSRRYNADGDLDLKNGKARELHIEEGLRLIDPAKQLGLPYVASLRRKAKTQKLSPLIEVLSYPANDNYQLHRIQMKAGGKLLLSADSGFLTWICLDGEAHWNKNLKVSRGEPGFVPFEALPLLIDSTKNFDLAVVVPASCHLRMTKI